MISQFEETIATFVLGAPNAGAEGQGDMAPRSIWIMLFGVGFAGLTAAVIWEETRDPGSATMYQYRIARLSDEQLRDYYADAERALPIELEQRKRNREIDRITLAEAAQARRDCLAGDIASRVRNPCGGGGIYDPMPEPPLPNVGNLFYNRVMGICNFVFTRWEARRNGCLPSPM